SPMNIIFLRNKEGNSQVFLFISYLLKIQVIFVTKMNVLKIQLYINLVLALLLFFRYHDIYFEVYLVILILALLVIKNKKIFQLISIIFLPVSFVDQLTYSMRLLIEILPNMSVIIYILYLAGLLVVIIPVTKEAYGVIKNP